MPQEEKEIVIRIPIKAYASYKVLTTKTIEEIKQDVETDDNGGLDVIDSIDYEFQDYEIETNSEEYDSTKPTFIEDPEENSIVKVESNTRNLLIEEVMNDIDEDRQNWEAFVSTATYEYLKSLPTEELRELSGNYDEEDEEEEED